MILDDLFAAAADFDTDRLATLMHPDVRFDEMPNRIAPNGNAYGFDAALAGFARAARRSRHRPMTSTRRWWTARRSPPA